MSYFYITYLDNKARTQIINALKRVERSIRLGKPSGKIRVFLKTVVGKGKEFCYTTLQKIRIPLKSRKFLTENVEIKGVGCRPVT